MGRLPVVVALLLAVALAGCAHPPAQAEVPVGTAPPGTPVEVRKPDETGLVPLYHWPVACELLTEADLRAILPSTTKVQAERKNVWFDNWTTSGSDKFSATDALCVTSLWFPGTTPKTQASTFINVTVRVAANIKWAKWNFDEEVSSTVADKCPATVEDLHFDDCEHDNTLGWAFRKNGIVMQLDTSPPSGDFHFAGQAPGSRTDQYWTSVIEPRLIHSIAARLP